MAGVPRSDTLEELYLPVGLSLVMFAVGLVVAGVFLLATCGSATVVSGSSSTGTVCFYPFQADGLVLFYVAGMVLILSANLFARYGTSDGKSAFSAIRCAVRSVLAVAVSTALLLLALGVLGRP